MNNPVLARNTVATRGAGATAQGIALITLLYLGFVATISANIFLTNFIVLSG